jgi:hypothetical protein
MLEAPMTTEMIRKQIYLKKQHNSLLKKLSQARGISEAEFIRQAIEREAASGTGHYPPSDQAAWQELVVYLERRMSGTNQGRPYKWQRADLYDERESRWLRDKEDQ